MKSLLRRLTGHSGPYQIDKTAVVHKMGKVINNKGSSDAIRVGAHTHIKGELLTFSHGGIIRLGEFCFVGEFTKIWSAASIEIGDRVLISHNVNIFDNATHPTNPRRRHEQFKEIILGGRHPAHIDLDERPVRVEDDVLIGCMSIILSGVVIGTGAIVGAGSVVTSDVPPFTVVAGNPARVLRELTLDERQ